MTQGKSIGDPQDLLIEQYKLYVEMADRISARRAETNKFYISLLTAGQYVKSCVKVQGLVELAMELASSAC